jgi:Lon protease-like protein
MTQAGHDGDPAAERAAAAAAASGQAVRPAQRLPLFPLGAVLFPGGLLGLRVFEARYLDLISHCLREGTPFGVVWLTQGGEVRGGADKARFEPVGVLAHVLEVDAEEAGILNVRCRGGRRFSADNAAQRADGLWQADATLWPSEDPTRISDDLADSRDALARAIDSLDAQGHHPFLKPYRLDDAGWVANRWCELLPIPMPAKHKLMALDEPALRLKLVDEYLRGKGVV